MAGGSRTVGKAMLMPAARDDKLELKVGKEGWFEVKLFLTEDGMTSVKFVDYDDDHDEKWDAKKFRSFKPLHHHIRVVSEQLQDEDCRNVSANQTVCALWNTENEVEGGKNQGWYDALVTKVKRLQHNLEGENEICTCLFTVNWLDGPDKGKHGETLTCGTICLHSTKDVGTHPLIVEILSHVNHHERGKAQEEIQGASSKARDVQRVKELGLSSSTAKLIEEFSREQLEQGTEAGIQDGVLSSLSAQDNTPKIFSTCSSSEREIHGAALAFRPAEAIKLMNLSPAATRLILTDENPSNLDAFEQSAQGTEAGIQYGLLSSQSVQDITPNNISTCSSSEREIHGAALAFRPAEAIKLMNLSPAATRLILTDENPSNLDAFEQSAQGTEAGIQYGLLSSQSVQDITPNNISTCSSSEREIHGAALDYCPAEAIIGKDLPPATARLVTTDENLSTPDPLEQSAQATDSRIKDARLSSRIAEDNRPTKKMRGQSDGIDFDSPDIMHIMGKKCPDEVSERKDQQKEKMSPNANSSVSNSQVQPKTTTSAKPRPERHAKMKAQQKTITSAEPFPERRARTRVVVDSTEEALQPKKETVKTVVDSLGEHHLHSRPSAFPVKDESVECKADSRQEHYSSSKRSGAEAKPDVIVLSNKAEVINEEMKTETQYYSRRKKVLAVPTEAHLPKRVRITLEFDVECESVSIVEGASPNRSVDESFGGTKKDPFLQAKVDEQFKAGLNLLGTRLPTALSDNEELVDSNSQRRPGSTLKSAICLSDEEEER